MHRCRRMAEGNAYRTALGTAVPPLHEVRPVEVLHLRTPLPPAGHLSDLQRCHCYCRFRTPLRREAAVPISPPLKRRIKKEEEEEDDNSRWRILGRSMHPLQVDHSTGTARCTDSGTSRHAGRYCCPPLLPSPHILHAVPAPRHQLALPSEETSSRFFLI